MKYELSTFALEDIDLIWEYTIHKRSIKQAEKYYTEIFQTIELICSNPEIGISISEIKSTHRKKLIGSHMIIYKFQNSVIYIDRILHQRMDIKNHPPE